MPIRNSVAAPLENKPITRSDCVYWFIEFDSLVRGRPLSELTSIGTFLIQVQGKLTDNSLAWC